MNLDRELNELYREKKITQRAIARWLKCSDNTVGRMLNGSFSCMKYADKVITLLEKKDEFKDRTRNSLIKEKGTSVGGEIYIKKEKQFELRDLQMFIEILTKHNIPFNPKYLSGEYFYDGTFSISESGKNLITAILKEDLPKWKDRLSKSQYMILEYKASKPSTRFIYLKGENYDGV